MADRDVQGLLIQIEATTAQLRQEMKRGETEVARTTKNMDGKLSKVDGAFDRMNISADKAVRGAVSSLRGLIAPITAAASAMALLSKGVDVQREFDRLNAGLITATGSSEKAAIAFEALREFAQKTPYDLSQAVEGFTKLVNLGLTPSEQALFSYGNTASAMGKDLNQMIEAVADAATGEFERLKEFGIKASKQGDQVSFTFQGVTTRIKNNAAEIEKYLIALGENQFAGAMEERMKTLDGAISGLGDTWDQTFRLINDAGAGELMRGAVEQVVKALEELNAMLESGQIEGYLDAIGGKFDGWGEDIKTTLNTLGVLFESVFTEMSKKGDSDIALLTESFKNFPENVRAFVQLMVVEVMSAFEKAKAYAVAFKDGLKAVFSDDTLEGVGERLAAEVARINGVRDSSIDSIIAERDASIGSYQAQIAAAEERRKKYNEEREQRKKDTEDRLAQNKRETEGEAASTAATDKKTAALTKQLAQIDLAVASALRQADAYWKGTDAVSELARQEKIEAEVLKLGEAAREKITASVNAEADARERMDLGKHYSQVLIETKAIEDQIAATMRGTGALEAYNVEKALAAQLAGKNADALTKESEQLRKAMTDQRKAAQDLEKIGRSGSVMDRLYPESKLMKDFIKDQEALTEARRRAEEANDPAAVARYTKALEDLGIEYEGNKRDATAWGKLTNEAIDRVDEAFANAWKGIFDGADNLWDGLKEGFKQTLAELAHMAITKPIIISFANQVLGTNTKGGISDVWGALFGGGETIGNGGGGSGGLGNIFTMAKNIYSIYDTLTGVVPAAWTGFQNGGLSGGLSAIGNYYGGAIGKVISTIFGETVTQTAAQISSQMGASAAGYSAEIIGQWAAQQAAQTTAQTTASSMLGSVLQSISGSLTNPYTWITAGAMASWKLYDKGIRADGGAVRDRFENASSGGKALGTVLSGASYAIDFMDQLLVYANKVLLPIGSAILGDKLTAVITGSPVTQAVNLALGRLFGGGEKYKTTVGSAVGQYIGGEYTGLGAAPNHYNGARRFGDDLDAALHDLNEAFSVSLGGLFETFDIDDQILTDARVRLRRTSGKLASDFYATIGDQMLTFHGQYAKGGNIALGMEQFFNAVMGEVLSKAIGISQLPEYLKELTGGLKTAEDVNTAIGGLFQRFEGVNAQLEALKLTAFGLTDAGLRAADSMLELSSVMAGLENPTVADKLAAFGSLTSTYYDKFFTDAEKNDALMEATKKQFEALELELPASREGFREIVKNVDLTTDAGRQMFMTLMQLAGQTAAYFDLVEQTAAASLQAAQQAQEAALAAYQDKLAANQATADAAFGVVQRSISAEQQKLTAEYQEKVKQLEAQEQAQAQAAAQAAQAYAAARSASLQSSATVVGDRVKSLESLIGALDSAMERLRDTSEETTKQLRAQAVATLEQALAGARAGKSVLTFPDLEEALGRASELDGDTFASLEDFQREQGRTANMVAELRSLTGKQLTTEERALKTLEDQLSVARSSSSSTGSYQSAARSALDREYELAMEALQKEMDEAQRQMDALNGIDNSVMSVVDAVNAMSRSVVSALQFMGAGSNPSSPSESTAAMVDRMYKAIAGFAPDSQGLAFWTEQLTTGKYSYSQFIKELEAARVPAFAAGGLHTGGLRLVGENGPELEVTGPSRIYSASQTAAMLSGGAAEEVRALRSDFSGMSDALRSIAKHTQQTARRVEFLERWDGDGMPGERTA